jgi:hypothetical protein
VSAQKGADEDNTCCVDVEAVCLVYQPAHTSLVKSNRAPQLVPKQSKNATPLKFKTG